VASAISRPPGGGSGAARGPERERAWCSSRSPI
jgi:hypothetical protein